MSNLLAKQKIVAAIQVRTFYHSTWLDSNLTHLVNKVFSTVYMMWVFSYQGFKYLSKVFSYPIGN